MRNEKRWSWVFDFGLGMGMTWVGQHRAFWGIIHLAERALY